jgi:hypothetical protein
MTMVFLVTDLVAKKREAGSSTSLRFGRNDTFLVSVQSDTDKGALTEIRTTGKG